MNVRSMSHVVRGMWIGLLCMLCGVVHAEDVAEGSPWASLTHLWEASCASVEDTVLGTQFCDSLAEALRHEEDPVHVEFPAWEGLFTLTLSESPLSVRFITWSHPLPEGGRKHMGLVVVQAKREAAHIIPLHDRQLPLYGGKIEEAWFHERMRPTDWLGAVYVDGMPYHYEGRSCFLLCGLAGGDARVVRRVVETVEVTAEGEVYFGVPCIQYGRQRYHRLMYAHSARVAMTLRPLPASGRRGKLILIDHLSPSRPQYGGLPEYYGPDGSQDALILQKEGIWLHELNVEVYPK